MTGDSDMREGTGVREGMDTRKGADVIVSEVCICARKRCCRFLRQSELCPISESQQGPSLTCYQHHISPSLLLSVSSFIIFLPPFIISLSLLTVVSFLPLTSHLPHPWWPLLVAPGHVGSVGRSADLMADLRNICQPTKKVLM